MDFQQSPSSQTDEAKWTAIRNIRTRLLQECDWTQLPDAPAEKREAWATYRQALRNIPQNFTSPDEVVLPEPPL